MDSGLKQRLIGATVLIALAVIFLPMLVKGPAPDSDVSDLPLEMPDAPEEGEFVTRELPLLEPAETPEDGAVGMQAEPRSGADEDGRLPTVDPDRPSQPAEGEASAAEETDASETMLPATAAGGDYAVHFGSYSSRDSAETVVERLRGADLPASSREATVSGRRLWRVGIGPYASRAEAEAVRAHAAQIGTNHARVVALDAATEAEGESSAPAQSDEAQPPSTPEAAPETGFVVQLGAFRDANDAAAMRDRARAAGFTAFTETVDTSQGVLTRVKVGPVVSRDEAKRLQSQAQSRLGVDGMVRSHP